MFGIKAREAQKTIDSQRTMLSQQEDRVKTLKIVVDDLTKALGKTREERDELKTQVRDQTEAALLLVSMKIVEKIKSGAKQGSLELGSLQQEQKRLRSAMSSYDYHYGDLQAMGVRR